MTFIMAFMFVEIEKSGFGQKKIELIGVQRKKLRRNNKFIIIPFESAEVLCTIRPQFMVGDDAMERRTVKPGETYE